jgi:hypothetical protein
LVTKRSDHLHPRQASFLLHLAESSLFGNLSGFDVTFGKTNLRASFRTEPLWSQ